MWQRWKRRVERWRAVARTDRGIARGALASVPSSCRGLAYGYAYAASGGERQTHAEPTGPLWRYFQAHHEGRGIWKWDHYFDIYERHLARFVGRQVKVVEVGVYSGGSLEMWRTYFGSECEIHGVDIESACRAYSGPQISIHIGDQGDRSFWRDFRRQVGPIDVLIDDGGHRPEQQRVTLEEMLPALRRGGVYLCEDIHGEQNDFTSFACGLVKRLNAQQWWDDESKEEVRLNPFQADLFGIHFYPYLLVVEKRHRQTERVRSLKRGTSWEPFL